MNTPMEAFELDEGTDAYGTHTQVKFYSDQAQKIQTFDAQPILEACSAERKATDGQRWGEMRKVGSIPMAIYTRMLHIKSQDDRKKFVRKWLKENPAFITFERYAR